jgi:hypothetical protein
MNNKLQNSLNESLNKVASKNKATGDYNPQDCECYWNNFGRGGLTESVERCHAISPSHAPIFRDPEGEPCEQEDGPPWGQSCCRQVYTKMIPKGYTVNCGSCQGGIGCRSEWDCITYYRRKACERRPAGGGKRYGEETAFKKTVKGRCCQWGSIGQPDAVPSCRNPWPPPPPPPSPGPGGVG